QKQKENNARCEYCGTKSKTDDVHCKSCGAQLP
ncbi:MAG: zinc ribbon domain-containing protein, partial [Bacteroidetes bacterium]|nr:zinc ribbon domain-containing protein [Bacteroidota bacterium]